MANAVQHMARNVLVIVANEATAAAVGESLGGFHNGLFGIEYASLLADGMRRLGSPNRDGIAAIIVDLSLPDSKGLDTFNRLLRTSRHAPILVICRDCDEDAARQAVRRGAQDYLLTDRIDRYSLPKALDGILGRVAYAEDAGATPRQLEHAQVTLDSIGDAVISVDIDGKVTYMNPVAERMTGWPRREALGRPLPHVLHIIDAESREPALNPLAFAIRDDMPTALSEHSVLVRRDGQESAIEDTAAPIHDQYGRVTGAVIVFHDVSVARAMSLRMSHLAQHDFLTQLPNRLLLNDRLIAAIAAAHRHQRPLAVLYIDVDHFKRVNDSRGHTIGDQLLQSIASRLCGCVRDADTVSRLGGDEFVVLLSELESATDAALSAEKILAALDVPHRIGNQELRATVSIGIGVYPDHGQDAKTLLLRADIALLNAKGHGGNNCQYFRPGMSARGNGQAALNGAQRNRVASAPQQRIRSSRQTARLSVVSPATNEVASTGPSLPSSVILA